jgi:hypothetical protein
MAGRKKSEGGSNGRGPKRVHLRERRSEYGVQQQVLSPGVQNADHANLRGVCGPAATSSKIWPLAVNSKS